LLAKGLCDQPLNRILDELGLTPRLVPEMAIAVLPG